MADTILVILGTLFSVLLLVVIVLFIVILRLTLQIRKLALDSRNALVKNVRNGIGSLFALIPSALPMNVIKRLFTRKHKKPDDTEITNTGQRK